MRNPQVIGRSPRCLPSLVAGLVLAAGCLPAAGVRAESLVGERLFLLPTQVQFGAGTVRLDAMGGFQAVVPDENFELNLHDFSNNPAGYGDDRDSWSIDARYSHQEMVQHDLRTPGNNVKLNEGSVLIGYHSPLKMGLGGRIDYAKVGANNLARFHNDYNISGFDFVGNRYFTPKLSLGARIGVTSEDEGVLSPLVYNITHKGTVTHAGLGAGYRLVPGVILGVRGEIIGDNVDGLSSGPFHDDSFTWKRPGGLFAVQGFVDRGRLHAGADFTHQKLQGNERVRVSWSERFVFNPTLHTVDFTSDTFSEDRKDDQFKARGRLDVVPGRISVGAAVLSGSQTFKVVTNPNLLGSLPPQDVDATARTAVGGATLTGLHQRLMVAGEVQVSKSKVKQSIEDLGILTNKLDEVTLRAGGEYLLGETLVGRAGVQQLSQKYTYATSPDLNGTYKSTILSAGIGLVPAGAIWQLDVAYDVNVKTDLNTDRSRFSAYVKYLF